MADLKGSGAVLFELAEPHIALVTLNRPEARNAVNGDVAQGLEAAVDRVEQDPEIRAAVLTGAGPHAFCAGADLKEVAAGRSSSLSTGKGGFAGFVRAPRSKLWIAAAQGHALAGGLELLLACDLAVAAETATFGLPEVKRSLVAGAGGLFRLPRALPKAIALQMIATGEPISAARAAQFGLVNEVVPPAEVLPAALALARKVCANAPLAVRESLAIARLATELGEEELWDLSRQASQRIRATEDFREGPRAFGEAPAALDRAVAPPRAQGAAEARAPGKPYRHPRRAWPRHAEGEAIASAAGVRADGRWNRAGHVPAWPRGRPGNRG